MDAASVSETYPKLKLTWNPMLLDVFSDHRYTAPSSWRIPTRWWETTTP